MARGMMRRRCSSLILQGLSMPHMSKPQDLAIRHLAISEVRIQHHLDGKAIYIVGHGKETHQT